MRHFKRIYIEITNVCNLSCTFCPKTKRSPQFMDITTFRNILENIYGYTKHLCFHIKGEPLLHPEIDKFLDISHDMGFKVNLTTNGTLIDKAEQKILNKPALRQVNFSLHSFSSNDKFITMEDYLNNVLCFTNKSVENSNTIIALRLWNLDKSDIRNSERQRNRNLLSIIENFFNLDFQIEETIALNSGIKLRDRVFLNQDYEFKWPDLSITSENTKGFCYGLRSHMGFLVDGTVVPCCLDNDGDIPLGNINFCSFSEILSSPRAENMFDGFSNGKIVEALCKRCGYRERFNG
ncbi:radical SAM/SPASM domain-containing protein [Clostridium oryzae]|uniref:Cyclic pyranopterin monophosphate synthase n=1 Tax=Clostridium oryzae TaxID=1450648 RepID=A0A1V4IFI3_9CLOT|nr:radical SAM/SPASM domain-containing protein [Clostridium oryzae]OPJ58696.1 cyclic pyranopterin monophosphate synthase [Clostridium oryzae]